LLKRRRQVINSIFWKVFANIAVVSRKESREQAFSVETEDRNDLGWTDQLGEDRVDRGEECLAASDQIQDEGILEDIISVSISQLRLINIM
jgi:hypothetical protein